MYRKKEYNVKNYPILLIIRGIVVGDTNEKDKDLKNSYISLLLLR